MGPGFRQDDRGNKDDGGNKKAGQARRDRPQIVPVRPGRACSTRALKLLYFFLAFLAFFAFFAFFAFLAIVSSQGYNGLNATREACSAEGQPRNILGDKVQQIRAALPRAVT
jgi:hypothetical protein